MNMARKTDLRPAVMEDRPYLYQSMACSDATPEMMGLPRFPDHPVPDYPTFYEDFDDAAFANESGSRPFIITAAGRDIGAACYTIRGRFAELDIWIAPRKDWGQGHGIRALEQLIALLDATGLIDGAIMRPSARTHAPLPPIARPALPSSRIRYTNSRPGVWTVARITPMLWSWSA
ncbi:MAG: GNAT family protein [Cyanobacteria bacterium MAG CAR1_bin_15]|nr:GNAT family protein [Cyanobacteria bacterium MAG CAR1_bin_15]